MRSSSIVALPLLLTMGCGLKKLAPEGPVLTPWQVDQQFAAPGHAKVTYLGKPRVPGPVLPLQVWGVAYELDLVLATDNPAYDMHEYSTVRGQDGLMWIAKDASGGTLEQTIVTSLEDPWAWFPEIPVRRSGTGLQVTDNSEGDRLDLSFAYTSMQGDAIEAHFKGSTPSSLQRKRNGSVMCHSRGGLYAAIDLPMRSFGRGSRISYDGTPTPLRKVLGLVPMEMSLFQVQGGLASGVMSLESPGDGSMTSTWTLPGDHDVSRDWTVESHGGVVIATQASGNRRLRYTWQDHEGALELVEMAVVQPGREYKVASVQFEPALVDVRRPFTGTVSSNMVIAVNGVPGMSVGTVEARWQDDRAATVLRVKPEAPWWTRDRHMLGTLTWTETGVDATWEMLGFDPDQPLDPSSPEVRFCGESELSSR